MQQMSVEHVENTAYRSIADLMSTIKGMSLELARLLQENENLKIKIKELENPKTSK